MLLFYRCYYSLHCVVLLYVCVCVLVSSVLLYIVCLCVCVVVLCVLLSCVYSCPVCVCCGWVCVYCVSLCVCCCPVCVCVFVWVLLSSVCVCVMLLGVRPDWPGVLQADTLGVVLTSPSSYWTREKGQRSSWNPELMSDEDRWTKRRSDVPETERGAVYVCL